MHRFSTAVEVGGVGLAGDDEGAHDEQEFSHDGPQGGHLRFACGDEAMIRIGKVVVAADGDHGAHVQQRAHARFAGLGHTWSLVHARAGVVVARRRADEGAELTAAREAPQVTEFGQDGHGRDETHAVDAVDQFGVVFEVGVLGHDRFHFFLDALNVALEFLEAAFLQATDHGRIRPFLGAVLLRHQLLDQRRAIARQFAQFGVFWGRWPVGCGPAINTVLGQGAGRDAVGIVAKIQTLSKVTGPLGVDDRRRDRGAFGGNMALDRPAAVGEVWSVDPGSENSAGGLPCR